MVQTADLVACSAHLPHVRSPETVRQARSLLTEISACYTGWREGPKPPKHLVVGMDCNVQLPAGIRGCTGEWTYAPPKGLPLHREQVDAVVEWAAELGLAAANTRDPPATRDSGQRWTFAAGRRSDCGTTLRKGRRTNQRPILQKLSIKSKYVLMYCQHHA